MNGMLPCRGLKSIEIYRLMEELPASFFSVKM
jgi:hypothetical protein